MSKYVNNGDINWSAGFNIASKADTFHASTNLLVDSGSTKYSGTWNGNASNTDIGVVVYLISHEDTGTITVTLQENASGWTTRASTTLTINSNTRQGFLYFFKYASPHTENAGTNNYRIMFTSDTASNTYFRADNAATTVIGIYQILSTTGTPIDGDDVLILGVTQASTGNPTEATVVIDDSAYSIITVGGDSTAVGSGLLVGNGGKLQYLNTATVDHTLRIKGNFTINGKLEFGTVANPIPLARTLKIELNYSGTLAEGKYGLIINEGSTIDIHGFARNAVICKLNTDEAAGSTVLGVDTDTGWKANDEIIICSTSRTYSEIEKRTLAIDATASELTISPALTYAHKGTSPVFAAIGLLTRNIKIYSYNVAYLSYVSIAATATVDIDYVEFMNVGYNAAGKYGIVIATTTGSCSMEYCSDYRSDTCSKNYYGFYTSGAASNNITLTSNITYNLDLAGFIIAQTSGTTIDVSYNLATYSKNASSGHGFSLGDVGITFDHNIASSNLMCGFFYNEDAAVGTHTDNDAYSNGNAGIYFNTALDIKSTLARFKSFRNGSYGLRLALVKYITFEDFELWGNTTANIYHSAVVLSSIFDGVKLNSDGSYSTTSEVSFAESALELEYIDCEFGVTTAGTNSFILTADNKITQIYARNTHFSDTNIISGYTYFNEDSFIQSHNHNDVANRYKKYMGGRLSSVVGFLEDQITGGQAEAWARGGSGLCLYFDPQSTSVPMQWKFFVPCSNGVGFKVSMYVKKTSSGADCTLTFAARGAGITEIGDTSVPLTDDWVEYQSGTMTPSEDGFVEITMKCLNGGTTGDVGIDDITIV